MLHREQRGRGAAGHADPGVDVLHVALGGAPRDHQPRRDLRVRQPLRDEPQDLDLARREPPATGARTGADGCPAAPSTAPTASEESLPAVASVASSPAAASAVSAGRCGRGWVIAW